MKLSLCIATLNRAKFISETLDSIVSQIEPEVELLILDGASSDGTGEIVERYVQRWPAVRYVREATNSGVDQDYDKAVQQAVGDYCWLMTDDDVLRPGAIRRVLEALTTQPDVVVVNSETRTADLSAVVETSRVALCADRVYGAGEATEFFVDCANYLSFIGGVVIKRTLWLSRKRAAYYGSLFIHVGVIFQTPPIENARLIVEPLIAIRLGNAMWRGRSFKWPDLVWSFKDFSDAAKWRVCQPQPWRRVNALIYNRALGAYTSDGFDQFIGPRLSGASKIVPWVVARIPGTLANVAAVAYLSLRPTPEPMALYSLRLARFANPVSRAIATLFHRRRFGRAAAVSR